MSMWIGPIIAPEVCRFIGHWAPALRALFGLCLASHRDLPHELSNRFGGSAAPGLAGRDVPHGTAAPAATRAPVSDVDDGRRCRPCRRIERRRRWSCCRQFRSAPANTQLRPITDVVADLHQVIDLGVLADHRIVPGAAVDAAVGAHSDAVLQDHPAQLGRVHGAGGAGCDAESPLRRSRRPEHRCTRSPIRAKLRCRRLSRCGNRGRWRHPGPITALAAIRVPRPILAPGPTSRHGQWIEPPPQTGRPDGSRPADVRAGGCG